MDACDHVMDKIKRPRGLIRYDSENNIADNTKKILTARVLGYMGVLVILMGLFGFLLSGRTEVETLILRTPGQLYQKVSADTVSNVYNYKMLNKTPDDFDLDVKLLSPPGRLQLIGSNPVQLPKGELAEGAIIIFIARSDLESSNTDLRIGIFKEGVMIDEVETSFNGPIVRK